MNNTKLITILATIDKGLKMTSTMHQVLEAQRALKELQGYLLADTGTPPAAPTAGTNVINIKSKFKTAPLKELS